VAWIEIPDGPGGEAAMIWSLRRDLGAMVNRMIEGAYEQTIVPAAERELARMRIAQINGCMLCAGYRPASVAAAGITDDLYDNVADYATYPAYTDRQRLAIEFAERYLSDHRSLGEEFFTRLRRAFDDAEILDLTMCIGVYLAIGRTLAVLRVAQACPITV
jgi:AhpD family alkylhydroperoxidase